MKLLVLSEEVKSILQGADVTEAGPFDGVIKLLNSLTLFVFVCLVFVIVVLVIYKKYKDQ